MHLELRASNDGARRFYERMGYREVGREGRVRRRPRGRAADAAQSRGGAKLARGVAMTASDRCELQPLRIAIYPLRAPATKPPTSRGALLVSRLRAAGHELAEKAIVRDDVYAIRAIVSRWIADEKVEVVIATGGTGLTGRDGTPAVRRRRQDDRGFRRADPARSRTTRSARRACSRDCVAGVANATYVFCLPGSSNACATGWDKLIGPQLDFRTRPCNLAELIPRLKE